MADVWTQCLTCSRCSVSIQSCRSCKELQEARATGPREEKTQGPAMLAADAKRPASQRKAFGEGRAEVVPLTNRCNQKDFNPKRNPNCLMVRQHQWV